MRRRAVLLIPVTVILLGLVLFFRPAQAQEAGVNNAALSAELLAALNKWRMTEGLYPLRVNGTLQAMAEDQAAYIQSLLTSEVSFSDIHADARGRNPRVRAAQSYNWPSYGAAERIHIGENAAIGSVRSSIAYWTGSDIHRRAALSSIYREVGVGALATPNGNTLFMVVFGARPNVLPALFDPSTRTLYLTEERSDYAPVYGSGLRITLFNSDGVAISGDQPWRASLTLPAGVPNDLIVAYYSPTFAAVSAVDLSRDLVIAPNTVALLPGFDVFARGSIPPQIYISPPGGEATLAATAVPPTLAAATAVVPTSGPAPTSAPPTPVPPTGIPTLVPTAMPTVALDRADLLLTYDANGFTLRALTLANLTGLSIGNATSRIGPENWLRVAQFPADALPRNHCLAANSGVDAACGYLRALLSLGQSQRFWNGPFDVTQGGTVIATCTASPCAVDIP